MPNFRLVLIGLGAIALVVMSVYGSLVLASPGIGGTSSSSNAPSVQLNGAGATLAYPLLSLISFTYTEIHPNVNINYQPIGSTGGVNQFLHKTVDFGATYPPMNGPQRAKATPPGALHIPEAISALAIAYNVRGVPTGLHLTGPILAAIYLGNITTWNDPAITSINPGANLPSATIETIHQEEGDGTTFVFTSYLNETSSKWAQLVGAGTFVQWPPLVPNPPPVSLSITSSAGIAALVQSTAGSIGYMELSYAIQSGLTIAAIMNADGTNYVVPSYDSAKAADQQLKVQLPSGDGDWSNVNLLNEPGPDAYPMVTFTYLIIYKELDVVPSMDLNKAEALVDFAWYAVHDGQSLGGRLQYVPLTPDIIAINEQSLRSVTFEGQPVYTKQANPVYRPETLRVRPSMRNLPRSPSELPHRNHP